MAAAAPPSITQILKTSWTFYKKHRVLNLVALWLLILPAFCAALIDVFFDPKHMAQAGLSGRDMQILDGIVSIVSGLFAIWGYACVLLIGARLLETRAGRARTSFKSVRRDGLRLVIPLLLTSILRDCFTFFWSLPFLLGVLVLLPLIPPPLVLLPLVPLLVPAFLYQMQTIFYDIIVVCEGIAYRDALRRSKSVTRGKLGVLLLYVLTIGCVLLLPVILLSALVSELTLLGDLITSVAFSLAFILFALSMIQLYGAFQKKKGAVNLVEVKL
jgi:uncharacterized membrane protein